MIDVLRNDLPHKIYLAGRTNYGTISIIVANGTVENTATYRYSQDRLNLILKAKQETITIDINKAYSVF